MTEVPLSQIQAFSLAQGIRGSRLAVAAVYNEIAARTGQDLQKPALLPKPAQEGDEQGPYIGTHDIE